MFLQIYRTLSRLVLLGLFFCILMLQSLEPLAETNSKMNIDGWVKPIDGVLTDKFGTRNGKHKGIDIGAKEGEQVKSVDGGRVNRSYYSDSYGHVIFILHQSGIETVYAHLSERHVAEGDIVKKGQVIGIVGSTGISTGTHLHFEAHQGSWTFDKKNAFDPLLALNETDYGGVAEVTSQVKIVVVKHGDTLWRISNQYNVSVDKLMKWNGLSSHTIYPNQELMIYT
ncbi:peptidoglycan DD-metalloendopeptidase family protein [Bacillus sp. FJAT-47783]|uniref:peptidoglycan DD-metalloendopeptidase family protein n=1 Tax=Bacillus sp. FJAT-47783 TaxID=2922712 RepID=UPI001FADA4D1|nr:peptidoglycan DD-metalloendopeptidase family protein [Bacillus sp. FJAT-47783]